MKVSFNSEQNSTDTLFPLNVPKPYIEKKTELLDCIMCKTRILLPLCIITTNDSQLTQLCRVEIVCISVYTNPYINEAN